ncbi:type 1 glutamine amidotransferase domain-containing protein [Niveibacterium sp. SC-1]|uniref:type 1 glutamine amidotransferase domain-containing protein n=1 Tax=Niveibacterium sp. SC-1 TaxID=3135646 RepID=UPI00311FA21C
MASKRILMVLTSHARMGDSGKATGLWAEEFAEPYYLFTEAGHTVEIATPAGGQVPFDPNSLKPRGENGGAVDRMLGDSAVMARLATTAQTRAFSAADFDAIFLPGGHGTMWDLPADVALAQLLQDAAASGGIVAAVCHGPAGLVSARGADGRPLVAGRKVSAFTDEEEAAAGLQAIVPFALETRLRELGAVIDKAAPWQAHAVRDGFLVTGQNPQSSRLVAEKTLEALGA